ncbi:MAG: hypothetical protein NW208_17940 [Bryobacter sp.]|nr:hypothetical protein [Bryobacter sp.]
MAEWTNLLDEAKLAATEQFQAAWKLHVDKVSEVLESGWRENIERIVEQRFQSLNEELRTANEEWLAKEVEERVAARLNEEWETQISQQVENRLGAEFDERVAARLEEVLPQRLEHAVAEKLEQAVAEQVEQRLEAAVSDRVVALLPDRVEEVLALRLAEELPGRLETERAQWQAATDAEWEAKLAVAKEEAAKEAAAFAEADTAQRVRRESRAESRQELGRQLGEALRVMRVAADAQEWKNAVLEAAAPFAGLAALFQVSENRFTLEGVRGVAGELETNFSLEYGEAAAFQNALESKDIVVAARTDSEVSPYVMSLKGGEVETSTKCYVFPVMVEDKVAALLYLEPKVSEGGEEPMEMGALETVITGAGLSLSAIRAARAVAASSLVNIASVLNPEGAGAFGELVYEPVPVGADGTLVQLKGAPVLPEKSFSWDDLTQEERENHMRAQRFARTQVAEMRLYKDDAVKGGRRDGNIYLRLKEEIDAARERYQSQFLDGQTHMRDYLHAELVETLAIDNPQLMGPDYPGPLV